MDFVLIAIGSLVVLGIIAALASRGDDGEVVAADGCAGCTGKVDCKLMELKQQLHDSCHQSATKAP